MNNLNSKIVVKMRKGDAWEIEMKVKCVILTLDAWELTSMMLPLGGHVFIIPCQRCVLPVLWMTSCSSVMGPMASWRYCSLLAMCCNVVYGQNAPLRDINCAKTRQALVLMNLDTAVTVGGDNQIRLIHLCVTCVAQLPEPGIVVTLLTTPLVPWYSACAWDL